MRIEITKELGVSPEDFYDFMIDSLTSQIRKDLDMDVEPSQLTAGYTHKVKSTDRKNHTETIRFTVKKAVRPREFMIVYSSVLRKTGVTYKFEPCDKGCRFTYVYHVNNTDTTRKPGPIKARIEELQARTRLTTMIGQAEADCRKRIKEREKEAGK